MKTFQSTPITFIDQTDSRKLEVYIKSNLPTVQIYNSNSGAYTPDWSTGEKLTITADVFLDSRVMNDAEYGQTTIKWYRNEISTYNEIQANIDKKTLQITGNELSAAVPIITYICEATYQGITASMRLTFTRVDTGTNGKDGEDGTGVTILGSYDSVDALEKAHQTGKAGDAYIVNGYLHVWDVDNSKWTNVGNIQGPSGKDAKSIVLSGNSQVFKVSRATGYTPPSITIVAKALNTSVKSWSYSTTGEADTFLSLPPEGIRGVTIDDENTITIVGRDLMQDALVISASDGDIFDIFTVYKAYDGSDGKDGDKGDPAPLVFLTNENVSFAANENGQIASTKFTTGVVAYVGTKQVPPVLGTISDKPSEITLESQTTKENEALLTFKISDKATLGSTQSTNGVITIPIISPVKTNLILNWSKINSGRTGNSGSNFKTFTTEYQAAQNNINDWAEMESTEWDVNESTSGIKAGDTVMIRCYNTTKQGYSYILATVISVPSDKKIHSKSTGLLDKGEPGTSASLVDVTPSAMYFKSTTGSTGAFTPEYIYLYPRFQNSTYSNWQYSRDGGATWTAASGANGLTIGTYNSVANSLRIAKGSTLYTDSITSISFKCNSTTSGIYDTVSIAKIYDVVDLQIGGRNLLKSNNLKGHGCRFENLDSVYNGIPTFKITTHTNNVGNNFGFTLIDPIEIAGGTYTVSYWYKFTKFQAATGVLGYLRVQYSDGTGEQFNTSIPSQPTYVDNINKWFKVEQTFTTNPDKTATSITHFYFYKDNALLDDSAIISYPKLEVGNTSSDWSPAPEDLIEEAANVNVMLSNEAHFFEATAGGVPIDTSVTLDVVGYKGSVKSATTVGTISGIPSAGMTATVANNNTTNTKLTIAITSALTSDIADYGILTIPITVNGHTINKIFNWTKAKAGDVGASGSDAVTFQVYSNNGYALSTSAPTIMLQTFAYVGDVEIKAGSTYQWYRHNGTDWVAVSGATNDYFNISRDDVVFSNNYMCKMQFNGTEYVGVVTIEDKNDENKVFASKPSNYFAGDLWIVGTDYAPSGYAVGTMLRAEHTNVAYTDNDWVPATKYDDEIKELKDTVDSYKQYFSVNSANGLQIGNASINNDILTIGTINTDIINANSSSFESVDIVGKYSGSTMLQAPVLNLGNFSIAIESNGSLSIVVNT